MRFVSRHIFALEVMLLGLFFGLSEPSYGQSSSRVRDLQLLEEEARVRLVFLVTARPEIKLACRGWNGVDISFPYTGGSKYLYSRVETYKSALTMSEDSSFSGLTFHLKSKNSIREIDGSWIPEKGLFFFDIYSARPPAGDRKKIPAENRLKDIRFGVKDKATRMVMELDGRPDWALDEKGTGIDMALEAKAGAASERKYGPMKRLGRVMVIRVKQGLNISLKPTGQPPQIRVFWLEEGCRLVMDLVDQPAIIDEGRLDLSLNGNGSVLAGAAGDEENSPVKIDNVPVDEAAPDSDTGRAAGGEIEKSPGLRITGKIDLPKGMPAGQADESLPGYIVRLKIPPPEAVSGEEKSDNQSAKTPLTLVADPRLDNLLPDTTTDKDFRGNLSPKEAFLYGRIEEAGDIHDFERGASLINRFLNEFPDSPLREKLFFWRGDFFYRLWLQGKPDAPEMAIKYLQEAVAQYGDSPDATPGLIKIAQVNSDLGNNHQAIGLLSILIHKKEPRYLPLSYLTRGKIYFKINQPEKAVEDLKTLLREYPDSPYTGEAHFWIADYLQIKGVYEQAKTRLDEIERVDPEIYYVYPEFLFLRAQNYSYLKQYDQARAYYYKGLNLGGQPEPVDMLLSRIGDTYHRQSKEKEAEKIYRLVVDYYPKSEGASIAKLRLADYTSDMDLLEEISRESPGEPITDLAVLEKANQYYEKEQLREVMDTLRNMVLKPVQTQTRQEAGQLFNRAAEKEITRLFRTRQYDRLIDLYHRERFLLSGKIDPAAVYLVGQAYYLSGQYQNAISTFLEIKSYDLDLGLRGEYLMSLADAYLKAGLNKKALEHLEKHQGDRLRTDDGQKLKMMLADIYREHGDLLRAFDKYRSVVQSTRVLEGSEIAQAYLYLGRISNQQKKPTQAVEYLNRCVALIEKDGSQSKNLSRAYVELGNSYYDRRQYAPSIRYYQQGLDLGFGQDNPDYWNIRYRLAVAYLESGEGAKAEPHFKEIAEEAGPILQQEVQVKLGMLGLEKQLNRLSIRSEVGE